MQIISDKRSSNGWITAVIDGRWVQAKVYDVPSSYGVFDCRVSKLSIGKTSACRSGENFFDQMAYHYDRGNDFDNLPDGVLVSVANQLNALPQAFPENATLVS